VDQLVQGLDGRRLRRTAQQRLTHSTPEEARLVQQALGQTDTGVAPEDAASGGEPTQFALDVQVDLQRRQVPVRRVTSTGRRRVFSDLKAVPTEWRERDIPGQYWQSIGDDPAFEEKLLRSIVEKL
jgi:hypothetical protein